MTVYFRTCDYCKTTYPFEVLPPPIECPVCGGETPKSGITPIG